MHSYGYRHVYISKIGLMSNSHKIKGGVPKKYLRKFYNVSKDTTNDFVWKVSEKAIFWNKCIGINNNSLILMFSGIFT
jgi:hypothetical protein